MKVFRIVMDANVLFNVRAKNAREAKRKAKELADWFRDGITVTTGSAALDMRLAFADGEPEIVSEEEEHPS